MNDQRLDSLLERYLDNRLTSEDQAELEEWLLVSPEARRVFWEHVRLHATLRELTLEAEGRRAAWKMVEAHGQMRSAIAAPSRRTSAASVLPFPRPARPRMSFQLLAACLVVFVSLGFAISHFKSPPSIATLSKEQGTVTLERHQAVLQAKGGESLRAGDIVRVGQKSSAVIRYADSTQLEIGADSILTLKTAEGRAPARSPISGDQRRKAEGKWVEIRQGSLSAVVAKQLAGQPMIFATPTAEATVVGTRLQLRVNDTSTLLEVKDGAVRLRRLADDRTLTVSGGEQAVAGQETTALVTTPINGLLPGTETATINPSGGTALYSNDMETAAIYVGGTLTAAQKYGGLKSEQHAANGAGHWSNISKTLPPGSVNSAFYRLWVFDNNNPTQSYRLGVTFQKPDLTDLSDSMSVYVAAGSGWTQISHDITSLVNTRISQGYTKIKSIVVWAYNSGTYSSYYLDDVVVEYQ